MGWSWEEWDVHVIKIHYMTFLKEAIQYKMYYMKFSKKAIQYKKKSKKEKTKIFGLYIIHSAGYKDIILYKEDSMSESWQISNPFV